MKLFGKDLFNFKKPADPMYDFAQHGLINRYSGIYTYTEDARPMNTTEATQMIKKEKKRKPVLKTPKKLYDMKALNDNEFKIATDEEYLDEQIKTIESKLEFVGKPKKVKGTRGLSWEGAPAGVLFGRMELESILERIKNRRKLDSFKIILDKYPHTTTELINKVLSKNQHLRCVLVETFIPDLPSEAINSMKEYNQGCEKLCGKKSVFYIIADREDFEKKDKRRDPILLAQSPFGFFWQILGAWDKEMVYLGNL